MFDRVLFNEALSSSIKTGQFGKIAEMISPYIRERIYEMSFIEQILKVRPVETTDLIPEEGDNDTLYVLGQSEQPTDKAVAMNFQGKPFTTTKGGRRYKIPLGYNTTPIQTKNEQEMLAFSYDLFADLEQKEIFRLHWLRDEKLIAMLKTAVALSGKTKSYSVDDADVVVYPEKDHFVDVANLLESGDRQGIPSEDTLKCTKFLMSQTMFNDLARWNSVDVDTMAAELAVKGWASTTILDKEFIVSTKNKLFVEVDGDYIYDNIWAFPDPDYLGEVVHVNGFDIKPEVWRENGTTKIHRQSSEFFAAGIGNYNGVSRIRLMRKYTG